MPGQGLITFTNNPNINVIDATAATVANIIIQRHPMGAADSRIIIEVNFGKGTGVDDPVSGNEQFQVMTTQTVFNMAFAEYHALLQSKIGTEFTEDEVIEHIDLLLLVDAHLRNVAETTITMGRRAGCVQWPNYVATTTLT